MSVATSSELARPNPTESSLGVTTPDGDHKQLINTVVPNVNTAIPNIPSFTKEQATPPGVQPIPNDKSGHIQPGIHAETGIDVEDMKDRAGKTLSHAASSVGAALGGEVQTNQTETASGSKVASIMRRLLHLKKAA